MGSLEAIRMYPYSTSLMGVVKGILDYYGMAVPDSVAFGASGHAFLMNIHEALCPSSPYCWDRSSFDRLLRNLGLEIVHLGFYTAQSCPEDRSAVERRMREFIDRGVPCALCNMENQIVSGYDGTGFDTLAPWPGCTDFPPRRLTSASWSELGSEIHISFSAYPKCEPRPGSQVRDALEAALDMYGNPSKYSQDPYSSGLGAYDAWIGAVGSGHGGSHGNWWNSRVWSECRRMASCWLDQVAMCSDGPAAAAALELSGMYGSVSRLLARAGNREIDGGAETALLREARSLEASAPSMISTLLDRLG